MVFFPLHCLCSFGACLVRLGGNSKYMLYPWLGLRPPIIFLRLLFFFPKAHGRRWQFCRNTFWDKNSLGLSKQYLFFIIVFWTSSWSINYLSTMSVQVPGGVTAAEGFKAAGIYGGLRAKGKKPDLALVACDVDAISAGRLAFTSLTNLRCRSFVCFVLIVFSSCNCMANFFSIWFLS